jgi:hypothetical protein
MGQKSFSQMCVTDTLSLSMKTQEESVQTDQETENYLFLQSSRRTNMCKKKSSFIVNTKLNFNKPYTIKSGLTFSGFRFSICTQSEQQRCLIPLQ